MHVPAWQRTVLAAVGTVLLVLALLILTIEVCAFSPGYYQKEYAKNETASYVGVSEDTLNEATDVLLDYLQGERDSLDFTATVNGAEREYYNEREKLHMEDVRDLNVGAITFMWVAFIAGGILVALAWRLTPQKWKYYRTCCLSILGVLLAFCVLGLGAAIDFTTFWISFHHVFFRNDMWTFDPRTSLLIRMFEEQFFFDLVGQILGWFLGVTLGLLVLLRFLWIRGKRKEMQHAHSGH